MKHIFLIGLVLAISLLAGCGRGSAGSVVGKYKYCCGLAPGSEYLEFTKDGHIILYEPGEKPKRGTYMANEHTSPMQIDINLSDEDSDASKDQPYTVAAIYKFEDPNLLKIKLANFLTAEGEELLNTRPHDFDSVEKGYRLWRCERVSPEEFQRATSSP